MTNEVALTNVLTPSALSSELAGFTFVPSDGVPFITLDSHRRFYFNTSLRKMFGLKAYSRVAIGYNADTKSIAILTKNMDAVPANFSYVLDKRHYASARKFVADFKINVDKGPHTYVFDRGTSVDGVYIFRLATEASVVVEPAEDAPSDAEPIPDSVTLNEGNRLQFAGIADRVVFVRYRTSPRQLEVSLRELPGMSGIYVNADGLSDQVHTLAKIYAKQRPTTFDFFSETTNDVLVYRKRKDGN